MLKGRFYFYQPLSYLTTLFHGEIIMAAAKKKTAAKKPAAKKPAKKTAKKK